tara:strand:+ start:197 stop:1225 length:1029 start_codon:yes stop_codon:yes gene_type:complete
MLGLSTGLMYNTNSFQGIFDIDFETPIDISGCVGWWDFTDSSTMYTNYNPNTGFPDYTPLAPTGTPSNGDEVERIDNKAYYLQSDLSAALGRYLFGSKAYYNGYDGEGPGQNSKSYIELWGAGSRFYSGKWQGVGSGGTGNDVNIFNWPLSETTVSLDNFTIFLVADARHTDGRAFSIFGDKEDANDSSRKEFHLYYDKTSTTAGQYKMDCYDGSTTTTISSGTAGKSDNFHIITGVLSGSGDSQLYRDGDNTDGTTSASSGSGSIDITHSSPDIYQQENRIVVGRNLNLGSSSDSTVVSPQWEWGKLQNSKIYEIICYSKELNSSELELVETFLKTKYDIS